MTSRVLITSRARCRRMSVALVGAGLFSLVSWMMLASGARAADGVAVTDGCDIALIFEDGSTTSTSTSPARPCSVRLR